MRFSYAELHAKTNFSFLEGASHPDELVGRAAELGYAALAITDRNSLAGVVRAHQAAKEAGLKLLVGAEITPEDAPPVVLWATDRAAYGRLARLITRGRRRAEKGQCSLTLDNVAEHAAGLLAGVIAEFAIRQAIPSQAHRLRPVGTEAAGNVFPDTRSHRPQPVGLGGEELRLRKYRELFGDRCYLLAELHRGPDDELQLDRLLELSRHSGLPLAAAGDVHYHVPQRQALGDVLTAIRHGCTVAAAGRRLFANAQRHLQSPAAMAALFSRARRRCGGRWRLPSGARFRWTSCVTSIPRSWRRRARRPPSTWPGWPGRGRPGVGRGAFRRACGDSWSTSCG